MSLQKLSSLAMVHLQVMSGNMDNTLCCKLGLQCGANDLRGGWGGQPHGRAGYKGVLKGLQQHWSQLHSQQPLTNLYISSIEVLLDTRHVST